MFCRCLALTWPGAVNAPGNTGEAPGYAERRMACDAVVNALRPDLQELSISNNLLPN